MPSLFLIPHTSLAPDLMLLPRTGSPLSKSPFSSLFLNARCLPLNRRELGIYYGPSLAPDTTDTNMIRRNWPWSLDIHRPTGGQDATESMRDTFYQHCGNRRKAKATPNMENSPGPWDPKASKAFRVTSATKSNHLL